jgi:hypothetical protein
MTREAGTMSTYETRGGESTRAATEGRERTDLDRDRDDDRLRRSAPEAVVYRTETDRRDRIRWGPVFAGLVVALSTYLLAQLLLIGAGLVDLGDAQTSDAVWSAAVAVVAFLLGGFTAGATAMWRGADTGLLHGIVLWAVGLVALLSISAMGGSAVVGSIDTEETFDQFTTEGITSDDPAEVQRASDDAQEAAGWASVGLLVALAASAIGATAGSKAWPGRGHDLDDTIDLRERMGDDRSELRR